MNETDDDKLTAAARRLATEIPPQRDLWLGIEAAIEAPAPQKSRWMPVFAQAAAVVLLVGASSGLTWLAMKNDSSVTPVYEVDRAFERTAAFGGSYELSPEYRLARADVVSNLEAEMRKLSPDVRAEVQRNLAVIRTAIGDLNAALEEDPDNALLQELLLKTYRDELDVMRRVGGLTQSVMSRNDI